MTTETELRAAVLEGFKAGYAACREAGHSPAYGALACPQRLPEAERGAWLEGYKHGGNLGQRHWAQYEDSIDVINKYKAPPPWQAIKREGN